MNFRTETYHAQRGPGGELELRPAAPLPRPVSPLGASWPGLLRPPSCRMDFFGVLVLPFRAVLLAALWALNGDVRVRLVLGVLAVVTPLWVWG